MSQQWGPPPGYPPPGRPGYPARPGRPPSGRPRRPPAKTSAAGSVAMLVIGLILLICSGGIVGVARYGDALGLSDLGSTPSGPPPYTQADVNAALLSASDLPGFEVDTGRVADDTGSDAPECLRNMLTISSQPGTARVTNGTRPVTDDQTLSVSHQVELVDDGFQLQVVRDAAEPCRTFVSEDVTYAITDVDRGSYGTETYAARIEGAIDGYDGPIVIIDIVWIRVDNLVSFLGLVAPLELDESVTLEILAKVVAKLPAAQTT